MTYYRKLIKAAHYVDVDCGSTFLRTLLSRSFSLIEEFDSYKEVNIPKMCLMRVIKQNMVTIQFSLNNQDLSLLYKQYLHINHSIITKYMSVNVTLVKFSLNLKDAT